MDSQRDKLGQQDPMDMQKKGILYSIYYNVVAIISISKFHDNKITLSIILILVMLCLVLFSLLLYLMLLILNDLYSNLRFFSIEKLCMEFRMIIPIIQKYVMQSWYERKVHDCHDVLLSNS